MSKRFVKVWVEVFSVTVVSFGCHMNPYIITSMDGGQDFWQENETIAEVQMDSDQDEQGIDSHDDSLYVCIPRGPDDNCNEIDDDCNGIVDDLFNKENDPENCGSCGRRCVGVNEVMECREGQCVFVSCVAGFADIHPEEEGCEYRCPVYPPTREDCNGVDDDCDGEVDEVDDLLPPPRGICRRIAGTPCENVEVVCDTRGEPPVTTWYCNYPPEVEADATVPNGIVENEALCDGYDGDCDTIADDSFSDLGLSCDNGLFGACRDEGIRVCDPEDPTKTVCDLSYPPDPLYSEPHPEECNGIDDDCDTIVDNAEGEGRVVDDMVEINRDGFHFWIYRYEASRPDATSSHQGVSDARPCSKQGVLPWTVVSFEEAQSVCTSVGKRLCTAQEYLIACSGPDGTAFPYGNEYQPDLCNGLEFDGIPGGTDDDVLLPTGGSMLSGCVTPELIYDLSGNAREWTDDIIGDTGGGDHIPIVVTRGGSYNTPSEGLRCDFRLSRAIATARLPSVGFRCCSSSPP